MNTTDKLTRQNWERITIIVLLVILAFCIAKMCSDSKSVEVDKVQTHQKQNEAAQDANIDTIHAELEKVKELPKAAVKASANRNKATKENKYKPTPSETDSVREYRAAVLRGEIKIE